VSRDDEGDRGVAVPLGADSWPVIRAIWQRLSKQQARRHAEYHANGIRILLSLCKCRQSWQQDQSYSRCEHMRNEHDSSRSGSRKVINHPIDLPDRSPDLNIRSGASIALWIACDDSALQSRMRKRAPSADGLEACTASTSARRASNLLFARWGSTHSAGEACGGAARTRRRARSVPWPLLALPQRCLTRAGRSANKPKRRS
jgi:hypothetical protein